MEKQSSKKIKKNSKKNPPTLKYKQPPQPLVNRSPAAFEKAFFNRIGQTPEAFIVSKIQAGSDIRSVEYLFDISSAAIAQQYHCLAGNFNTYYTKAVTNMPKIIRYNKLVRDRIPEIIELSGKKCRVEILNQEQYIEMLDVKLQEELTEYQQSKSLEELADLLEVMGAVVRARGYTWEQLTDIRKAKLAKRGGFNKKILLKEVIEG